MATEGTKDVKVAIVTDCGAECDGFESDPVQRNDFRNEAAGWWRIIPAEQISQIHSKGDCAWDGRGGERVA